MRLYFAYGSCTNISSFEKTLKDYGSEGQYEKIGVARLDGFRLAFTRHSSKRQGGVLDIIESPGDYVLGLVSRVSEDAEKAINIREGYPGYYDKEDEIPVILDNKEAKVFTYRVLNKLTQEIPPHRNYYDEVLIGMVEAGFPQEYIGKYLINHVNTLKGL